MELAAALHHSRDVGPGTYAGLRAQKAASSREEVEHAQHVGARAQKPPLPGERPGVLKEPGAQGVAASTRCAAAAVPLLSAPRLADPAAEDVDYSTIQVFLVRVMVARANEEADEEDRRRAEEARKLDEAREELAMAAAVQVVEDKEEELAKLGKEQVALLRIPAQQRTPSQEQRLLVVTRQRVALHGRKRKRKKRRKRRTRRATASWTMSRRGRGVARCLDVA